MKKYLSILVLLLSSMCLGQSSTVRSVLTLPSKCSPGNGIKPTDEISLITGGLAFHYVCTAANTWTMLAPTVTPTFTGPVTINGTVQVNGTGNVNGIQGADSGTNAQADLQPNTYQFASGTPQSLLGQSTPSSSYWPQWVANIGGTQFYSDFELRAEIDDANGYPSLCSSTSQCVTPTDGNTGSGGIVPLDELLTSTAGCTSSTYLLGDQSGCGSTSSSVAFNSVQSGTNNTANMQCAVGCIIGPTSSSPGTVNANKINGYGFPVFTGLAPINSVIMTGNTGTGVLNTKQIPDCNTQNSAIVFFNTSGVWGCATVGSGTPRQIVQCVDSSGVTPSTCPNDASQTVIVGSGTAATYVLQSFKITHNTIPANHCVDVVQFFEHTVNGGAGNAKAFWNINTTAPSGTYPTQTVTGGTNMNNNGMPSGTQLNFMMPLTICNYNNSQATQYAWQMQVQEAGNSIAGSSTNLSINTASIDVYINLMVSSTNVADNFLFNGGWWEVK